ncbi:unnamed protein product, partial [marine sediment metagenome]
EHDPADNTPNVADFSHLDIVTTGNLGIGEVAPETLIEMTSTVPYFTFHNSTEENTAGGRESKLLFKGEKLDASEHTLASMTVAHDGSGDDQKGYIAWNVNDGDDADAPTERMRLLSSGCLGIRTDAPDGGLHLYRTNFVFESGSGTDNKILSIQNSAGNERFQFLYDDTNIVMRIDDRSGNNIMSFQEVTKYIGYGTLVPLANVHYNVATGPTALFYRDDATIVAGNKLGYMGFGGDGGEESTSAIEIKGEADGTWAAGDTPSRLSFYVTPDNTAANQLAMIIRNTGKIGINEISPETLVEMTGTESYFTFHNSTEEDADEGRESIIWFSGEQSGGEETHLGAIKAFHDGAADDQKGALAFYINDGTDNDVPTERMRIDSAGLMTVTGSLDVTTKISSGTLTLSAAGPTDDLDVSGVNTIFIDTSSNNVILGGTTGGVDGQVLYVIVHDATNDATIEDTEG